MKDKTENKKETLGLILVTWNRRDELRICLESIVQLNPPPDEIIIVDNHSTDGTIPMLEKDFPQVKYIVMPGNAGLCQAANVGFATSQCDYVGIIESDMELSPNWVSATIEAFKEDSSLALVCPLFLHKHKEKGGYYDWEDRGDENGYLHCTNGVFTVKKSVFEEADQTLYAPHYFLYAQELEISARIINMGYKMKRIKNAATFHNMDVTPGSSNVRVSLARMYYYNVRNNLWNLWTFHSFRNILFFTPLYILFYIQDAYRIDYRYKGRRRLAMESPADIIVFFKGFFAALRGINTCLKRRQVVDMPHYKNIIEAFRHKRRTQNQRPIYDEVEIVCQHAEDFMKKLSQGKEM